MGMNQMEECSRCKKKFPLIRLQTLEISNESFRRFAARKPGEDFPVFPENEVLAKLGLDSSMIFCSDCKAFLDNLIKQKQ